MSLIFLFASILGFLLAPQNYNSAFVKFITIAFMLQSVFFIIKKSKGDYLNFYSLFLFSFFFVNFFYPSILYPIDPEFFSFFRLEFNYNYINKGTALAFLCSSFMIFGADCKNKKLIYNPINIKYYISHLPITYFSLLLFILFISTVGADFLSGNFVAQSQVSLYVLIILTCSVNLASVIFFSGFPNQNGKNIFYILILLFLFLFLSIGDRGPALQLIILQVTLYAIYIKKITAWKLVAFAISGFFLMSIIAHGRSATGIDTDVNIIERGIDSFIQNDNIYLEVTRDFVVNARSLYVGLEYVDDNGVNFGYTLISPVLAVIPFMQQLVSSVIGEDLQGSAGLFTSLALGDEPPFGLGTNIIADIYISFGVFGCAILFFLLGYYTEKLRTIVLLENKMTSNIIYFTLLSYSIYLPRTSLFSPIRFLIWTYLLYLMLMVLKILKVKRIKEIGD